MAAVVPITCNPPRLVFGDATSTQVVRVKLPRKPTKPVDVFYNSPSLLFKQCMLRFTEANWDKEQELVVAPSPLVEPAELERQLLIKFTSASQDVSYHNKLLDYKFERSKEAGAICTGTGDPHYRSFGGKTFDYMGTGCHYYVKSQRLTVMAYMAGHPKHPGVSIATGLAVRYGKARWIFRRETGARLASANTQGMTIVADATKKNYRILTNDGAIVSVIMNAWDGDNYLDITITLPRHYKGQICGLCGDIDNNNFLKFPGRPSDAVNDVKVFAESYRVPANDDIFTCNGAQCAGDFELKIPDKFHHCTVPAIGPNYLKPYAEKDGIFYITGYTEQENPPKYADAEKKQNPGPAPPKDGPAPVDPKCIEERTKLCKQILTCAANELVDPSQKIKECAFDACATKSIAPLEATKRVYHARVFERCNSVLSDKIAADRRQAILNYLKERHLNGQGDKQVCKNGGDWSPLGCLCKPPYSGGDCSIKCA